MEKILNGFLMMVFLVVLYFCMQKYKQLNTNPNIKEGFNTSRLFSDKSVDLTQDDAFITPFRNIYEEPKQVQFDYEVQSDIDKQFLKEQESGAVIGSYNPNIWIDKIDNKGQPIYNNYANMSGNHDVLLDSKARLNHNFDKLKVTNLDAPVNPDSKKNSIWNVFDNSLVDYKTMIKPKKLVSSEPNTNFLEASSNLSFITPDVWVYGDEKPENGGQIMKGFYASDPTTMDSVALY